MRATGRNEQRCAISTVEASASGRSANCARHLGAGLEAMLDGELAAIGLAQHAPLGDAQERVMGLVVVDGGEEGSLVATSGMPLA